MNGWEPVWNGRRQAALAHDRVMMLWLGPVRVRQGGTAGQAGAAGDGGQADGFHRAGIRAYSPASAGPSNRPTWWPGWPEPWNGGFRTQYPRSRRATSCSPSKRPNTGPCAMPPRLPCQSAEADLLRAETELKRVEKASKSRAVSEMDVDRARADRDMAIAAVAAGRGQPGRGRAELQLHRRGFPHRRGGQPAPGRSRQPGGAERSYAADPGQQAAAHLCLFPRSGIRRPQFPGRASQRM